MKRRPKVFDQERAYAPGAGPMTEEDVNEFLASQDSRWLIKLSCLKEDGWPYVVPLWYQWDGSDFYVVGRKKSIWVQDIRRDPRCYICIEEKETPPKGGNRKVLARCRGEVVEGPSPAQGSKWLPVANEMAIRYLGPDGAEQLAPSHGWERYLVKLTPIDGLTTWQGVDWAPRYFEPGQRPDLEQKAAGS
jgi:hypothetical protein